jgi:hypothetical protein
VKLDAEYVLRDKDNEIRWLRERVTELEDRLMHMADKPWSLPPLSLEPESNEEPDIHDPEQSIREFTWPPAEVA